MRWGIDARELTGQPTGVGRVLAGLLKAWPADDEIVLYAREPLPWGFVDAHRRSRVLPGPTRLPGAVWEQTVLPGALRRDRVDAFFAPAYGMPVRARCGVVVGMHDCACEATPAEFGWRQRARRRWAARAASRRADYLFAGSRFSAGEIRRWYGVARRRVVTAPYGLDDRFRNLDGGAIERARQTYGLAGRSILFVGATLGRRNLAALIETTAALRESRPDVNLHVVGPRRGSAAGIDDAAGERAGLRWLGYVPDDDLPGLYGAATVVAYPSSYEGFGFPVLEALACGTPVVASAAGSLPEIFAGRAWLVDDDLESWRTALAALLDEPSTRQRWVETAQPWARRRRWGPAARLLRCLLREAAWRPRGNDR